MIKSIKKIINKIKKRINNSDDAWLEYKSIMEWFYEVLASDERLLNENFLYCAKYRKIDDLYVIELDILNLGATTNRSYTIKSFVSAVYAVEMINKILK